MRFTRLIFSFFLINALFGAFLFSSEQIHQKTNSIKKNISYELHLSIKNIIGEAKYTKNKNLIKFLFKNAKAFYNLDNINYATVYKVLYDNNLLDKNYKTPKNLYLEFILPTQTPLKDFKILKDILNKIGYISFSTTFFNYQRENNILTWRLEIKAKKPFDIVSFSHALMLSDVRLKRVVNLASKTNKNQKYYSEFSYQLDFANSYASKAFFVRNYEKIRLPFSFEPVLIRIQDAKSITLSYFNKWYAFVIFYDQNLEQIGFKKSLKAKNVFYYAVPKNTKYVRIQDTYEISNIHKGISVVLKD